MKNKYIDLIDQTFDWPQEGFLEEDGELYWHDINMMSIIKQYGTPLKVTYLPKISSQIQKAKKLFGVGIAKSLYQGEYNFCYCTKSSHFSFVLEEVLKNDVHIETSSAFDINIVETLHENGKLSKKRFVLCNGFKMPQYLENIGRLLNNGWDNVVCILDNKAELDQLKAETRQRCKIGIRIASEEDPKFEFYTSRLGVGYKDIIPFYEEKIKHDRQFQLKMLHFFINTGINDTAYYWNELSKAVNVYIQLKKVCPELDSLNIGGGLPIINSLSFDYDYEYMAEEIVSQIKQMCNAEGIKEPNIFTEFGSFTVGESGATLFRVVDQKQQNDREHWDMIDSSFMTTLPDTWALNKRFVMLPLNNWDREYERVLLGGLTCDSDDYYNWEMHKNAIYLPKYDPDNPQYLGFFHTGAYQESVGGYGGIQHCLIPCPKHIIIDRDEDGEIFTRLFAKEQSYKSMLKILGY